MHLVPDMRMSAHHQCVFKNSVMRLRCTFGDVPPRVDAVKIYKNVSPDDQVNSCLTAFLLGRTVLHGQSWALGMPMLVFYSVWVLSSHTSACLAPYFNNS